MLKKVIPIILLLTFAGFISVFGQVPKEMTYQGVLTDAAEVPLTGNYQLTFRVYDVASGGSALWTEIHTSVDVLNGLFRVYLGTVNPLDLPFDMQYYVSVQVENETELGTRMRLTSVGYSFSSIIADSAETISDNAVTTTKIANQAVTQAKIHSSVALPPGGSAGGDLTGTYPDPSVAGLRGRTVSTTAPGTGQVLEWNGSSWAPGTDDAGGTPSGTAGGDLTGTYPNPTVDGLRGRTVSTTAPGTGQVLEWSGTEWVPGTDDSGGTPSGTAGGDLTGTYPDPNVAGLRGRTVSVIAPTSGQVLEWSGTEWAPGTDDSGGTPSGTAGGDLTGTYPNPTVDGLRGRTVATTAPGTNQVLKWNGSSWAPGTDDTGGTPSGTAGGDLAGTYPNPTVDGLRGRLVSTTAPSTGQVLEWNGSSWAPGTDNIGGNTLDQAYDQGGLGAGRTINATAGAVNITGSGGLTTSGQIDHNYGGSSNALNAIGTTASNLAMYWIANNLAGNGWGLSAGMNSSSAGASSYGVMGWNNGTGYGVYGRSLNASGYAVYGANTVSSDYAYLVGPSYAVYGYENGGNFGFIGSSSYGAYGYHNDGNYGYVGGSAYGMYANLITTDPGDYAIFGYGVDATGENGTGYGVYNTLGGVRGYNFYGNPYTFGVAGYSYLDYDRSGGCFGARYNATVWGCLGYQNVGGTEYGCYATGGYGSPIGEGQASVGIGIGSWGDLFGADIHGKIYGLYSEGGDYALYTNGTVFKNDLDVHLQETKSSSMSVLYTNVSTDVTVQTSGYSKMSAGECQIEFDDNFKKVVSDEVPVVVTVTPIGMSKGVFVSSVNKNGFAVVENDNGKSNVDIAFIAIGRRAGYENPTLPEDVILSDYTDKITRGLHNDALKDDNGEGLYYENGKLYVGRHYSTQPDLNKVQEEKEEPQQSETPQPPPKDINDNNGKAPDKTR